MNAFKGSCSDSSLGGAEGALVYFVSLFSLKSGVVRRTLMLDPRRSPGLLFNNSIPSPDVPHYAVSDNRIILFCHSWFFVVSRISMSWSHDYTGCWCMTFGAHPWRRKKKYRQIYRWLKLGETFLGVRECRTTIMDAQVTWNTSTALIRKIAVVFGAVCLIWQLHGRVNSRTLCSKTRAV